MRALRHAPFHSSPSHAADASRPQQSSRTRPRQHSPANGATGAPTRGARATRRSTRSTRATSTRSRSRGSGTPAQFGEDEYYRTTPLYANGRLFTVATTRRKAFAIDPATGKTLWKWGMDEGIRWQKAPRQFAGRGLAYWTDGATSASSSSRRAITWRSSTRRRASPIRSSARTASST